MKSSNSNSDLRRIARNFASLFGSVVFNRLLNAISFIYVTRMLGPANYGLLSFGLTVAMLLSLAVNFGLDDLLIREIARQPDEVRTRLGDAVGLKTLFTLPVIVLGGIAYYILPSEYGWFFLILLSYSLLRSYLLTFCAVFRGLERMEFQMFFLGAETILVAIGSIVMVHVAPLPTPVSAVYLVSTFLIVVGSYGVLVKEGIRPRLKFSWPAYKALAQATLPFGVTYLSLLLFDRLATLLVFGLCGRTAAGWFNSVSNLVLILSTIPSTLISAIYPTLARKAQENMATVVKICTNTLKYMAGIGLGGGILLYALAPYLLLLLGKDYGPSVQILEFMALGVPFLFLGLTIGNMLQAVDHQADCTRAALVSLGVAIPLTAGLVFFGGHLGGSAAYSISYLLLTGILYYYLTRAIGDFNWREAFELPAVAGAATLVLAYLARGMTPVLYGLVLGGCYAGVWSLKILLTPSERAQLFELWQSRRSS